MKVKYQGWGSYTYATPEGGELVLVQILRHYIWNQFKQTRDAVNIHTINNIKVEYIWDREKEGKTDLNWFGYSCLHPLLKPLPLIALFHYHESL